MTVEIRETGLGEVTLSEEKHWLSRQHSAYSVVGFLRC